MISTNNVTLQYGSRELFKSVSINFTKGNCYGLIGANGAGKSTFLKVLSGEIEPNKGYVSITPGERLSVLKQDHYAYDDFDVIRTVLMGNAKLVEIMDAKEELYAKEESESVSLKRNLPKWTAGARKVTRKFFSTRSESTTSSIISSCAS